VGVVSEETVISSKIRSLRQLSRIVLVNFGVLVGLYLLTEIALHIISSDSNPFLEKIPVVPDRKRIVFIPHSPDNAPNFCAACAIQI